MSATFNYRDYQYAGEVIALTIFQHSAANVQPSFVVFFLRHEELLNMSANDKAKYSRVEDLGDEDAGPSEEVAKKASAKRLGKWASDRRQGT